MDATRDILRLKRSCVRKHVGGASIAEICTAAQIPRRTFYNWWSRYRKHDLDGLKMQPKTPRTIHRTPTEVTDEIKAIRVRTGWGPHKIAGYLRTEGTPVGHMTVYRTLLASGLNHPLTKPRIKRKYRRWQRMHPNSRWHCDLKVLGPRWLVGILDDYSRFVTGSEHFTEGTAENAIWLFDKAVHEFGKPRETLIMAASSGVCGRVNLRSTCTANS